MPIIEVSHISKKYTLSHQNENYLTLRDKIGGFISHPIETARELKKLKREEFWALRDVSFNVEQREVIGIIGANGAGKSTLLKILSQITPPTAGEIKIKGKVASLLEVGTGFHPELTGRENIFLNGAILGMAKKEIEKKFDEIVDFSGIEKFLDTPVKRYSSGMYVRLAFSVAAHMEPDILLIDEVLAVGDAEFQKKCLGKMDEVTKKSGRTILFVSHNLHAVRNLCKRSILLQAGKLILIEKTETVINNYFQSNITLSSSSLKSRVDRKGEGNTFFSDIIFNNEKSIGSGRKLEMKLRYISKTESLLKKCRIGIAFNDSLGQFLFICSTEQFFNRDLNLEPNGYIECSINKLPLSQGDYYIDLFFETEGRVQDWIKNAAKLSVESGNFFNGLRQHPSGYAGKGVLVEQIWKNC